MIIYVTAQTTLKNVRMDALRMCTKAGQKIELTWDESTFFHAETGFIAIFKGVCINDVPANGKIHELESMEFEGASVSADSGGGDDSIDFREFVIVDDTPETPDCEYCLDTVPWTLAAVDLEFSE